MPATSGLISRIDVELDGLRDLERRLAGLRFVDPVSAFEEIAQDGEVGPLVVDDENPASAGLPNAVQHDERAQTLVQHEPGASPSVCSKCNFSFRVLPFRGQQTGLGGRIFTRRPIDAAVRYESRRGPERSLRLLVQPVEPIVHF